MQRNEAAHQEEVQQLKENLLAYVAQIIERQNATDPVAKLETF